MAQPASQPDRPAHRDMMFCHECRDEWFRDEHGLTCPECGSDFTEIIEDDHDPRDNDLYGNDDDNDSMPSLEEVPPNTQPVHNHNPWREQDDPDESDITGLRFRQLGPGRFTVTGTMYRTLSPADLGRGGGANQPGGPIGGFASMLNNIITGGQVAIRNQSGAQDQGQAQGASERNTTDANANSGSGTTPGGHRFTYTAGARLFPRDANHPGPHMEPVDELNNVLVGLMAAFGEPPGQRHHHQPFQEGLDDHNGSQGPQGHPLNPLMAIFTQMMGGTGQVGDAVYSQEALDRIISQLMEQNAGSNAPPPASQTDIDTLPRKQVTVDMLGPDGRADCSICMDEVNVGEEVAELPCHHWFHHGCVAAWLGEHNTCPHCRQSISKQSDNTNPSDQSTGAGSASAPNPGHSMPGSFDVAGDGTPTRPFVVPSTPAQNQSQDQNQSQQGNDAGSGGGISDRIRRGWFGSS